MDFPHHHPPRLVRRFSGWALLIFVASGATGCLKDKLSVGDAPPSSSTPPLTTVEQTQTYNVVIPSQAADMNYSLSLPQFSGDAVLDKAVVTITLNPVYNSICENDSEADTNSTQATLNFGVAGQGAIADLVDASVQALSGTASSSAGEAANVSPAFLPYTYTIELANPTDSDLLEAFTGAGSVALDVTAQMISSVTCGPGTSSDSMSASGTASVVYTYSGLPVPTASPSPTISAGDQVLTFNTVYPAGTGLNHTPVTFPQYPGEKQLEKVVLTVTFTPVAQAYCISNNSTCNITMSGTFAFDVAGQGAIAALTNTSSQTFSASGVSSGPGQTGYATPTFQPYTYTVEYDYPADAAMLAGFSGTGLATLDLTDTVNGSLSGSGNTEGDTSSVSGSLSLTYTYPQ